MLHVLERLLESKCDFQDCANLDNAQEQGLVAVSLDHSRYNQWRPFEVLLWISQINAVVWMCEESPILIDFSNNLQACGRAKQISKYLLGQFRELAKCWHYFRCKYHHWWHVFQVFQKRFKKLELKNQQN